MGGRYNASGSSSPRLKNRLSWLNNWNLLRCGFGPNAENAAFTFHIGYRPLMTAPQDHVADSRRIIDEIDHALIDLLARRRTVVKDLFAKKQAFGLPLVDAERETQLLEERQTYAHAKGVSAALVASIFRKVLEDSHSIDATQTND
jgi:chorismate mutase